MEAASGCEKDSLAGEGEYDAILLAFRGGLCGSRLSERVPVLREYGGSAGARPDSPWFPRTAYVTLMSAQNCPMFSITCPICRASS